MSSAYLPTTEDNMAGAMVMMYDLTQLKKLEQNVQRAHRLSSIGTLAAGMAHEIKNPLVSIKTFAQLLLKRYDDPDFRTTFTDVVPNEVQRIDSIVTRLLHFARPQPANFAPYNLKSIISEVLVLVENQTRGASADVKLEFPETDVIINGDEQQLHQVFLNLVLNAIDAMEEDKGNLLEISCKFDRMRIRQTTPSGIPEIDCAKLSIIDSGTGISEESIDKLFTPFFTTKEDGTGLGLSIVHGILTEHQGEIYVENNSHGGATFVIVLPLLKQNVNREAPVTAMAVPVIKEMGDE